MKVVRNFASNTNHVIDEETIVIETHNVFGRPYDGFTGGQTVCGVTIKDGVVMKGAKVNCRACKHFTGISSTEDIE